MAWKAERNFMNRFLKFNGSYFLLAILLFIIEALIALFIHDNFIRPYFGDFLVVILVYCFLKSFLVVSPTKTAIAVLVFAYGIEILQYYNFVERLGLGHSTFARVILGSSFEWIDIVTYTLGVITILVAEKFIGGNIM